MKGLFYLLERPRLTLSLAFVLSSVGLAMWFSMPREEDPRLAERFGIVIAPYPGADVLEVERLVASPLEDALAEVEEIETTQTTIRAGVAVVNVTLLGSVTDTNRAWDRLEEAIDEAHAEMPEQALPPSLDHELTQTESVLIALTGPGEPLVLADRAEELKRQMLALDLVSRVDVTGDPGERITVDLDDSAARRLGIDMLALAERLDANDSNAPAGSLRVDGRQVTIRPGAALRSVEAIAALPVPVGTQGASIPLGQIAHVSRRHASPVSQRARHQGSSAVVVGVIPKDDVQAQAFGEQVRAEVERFAAVHPGLDTEIIAFQPQRVEDRLSELGTSLLVGVAIVAIVLVLFMGLRMGVVVASVVPLVTLASVGLYAASGGVLHQMAVAALVIALGLLVDNAIVVAETMQRRLDEGMSAQEAMRSTIAELALPLGAATGTTLASFVPMLLAEGTTGDFTRAIPVVVMLTLVVSYAFALLVTPLLARAGLRPSRSRESRVDAVAGRLGAFATAHPWPTLAGALLLIGGSGAFATGVRINFFPATDRDQVVVEIELPESTDMTVTDSVSADLEAFVSKDPDVETVTSFIGRSAPSFYYNLPRRTQAPHFAQLLINTRSRESIDRLRHAIEAHARDNHPDALVIARRLEQGPPVLAPIEMRLLGDDLHDLQIAASEVRRVLRDHPGARLVRDDLGLGAPTLRIDIDDASASRHGVDRGRVTLALLGHSRGLPATTYYGAHDPASVVVRSSVDGRRWGEAQRPLDLEASDVARPGATPLPLGQVAQSTLEWQPAVIHHRNGSRIVSVLSEHADDVTYASVLSDVMPTIDALSLPEGVRLEVGGAVGESQKANSSLGSKAPIAALILIAILLAEFNSFRRMFIVLTTAPLAALGIWPGLYLLNQPFGFVALLGAIALIGIAVNGAIVLLDVTESRRKEGASISEALSEAVRLRTRPILLTTATTVAGLMPLLVSESTLWPPMAAAMISGLVVSTLLSLAVVPALYRLLFREAS